MTNHTPIHKTYHTATAATRVAWIIVRSLLIISVIVIFGLLTTIEARSETVTRKEATSMAQAFINEAHGKVMAPVKMVYDGRRLTTQRLFVPFYVFTLPGQGFVIVSAENKTFPILAYSLTDKFTPENLTEAQRALLRSYAYDIEMIRYDSRVPSEAIAVWQAYPEYVHSQLSAASLTHNRYITSDQASDMITECIDSGEAPYQMSDIFTPAQWQGMVDAQLNDAGNAVVGLVKGNAVTPMVVYARKGDFYRIALPDGKSNDWYVRLMPSELLSGLQIGCFNTPVRISVPEVAEAPFALYESFASEAQRDIEATYRGIYDDKDITITDTPQIENYGGGHYVINFPAQLEVLRLYNINGLEMIRHRYSNSTRADLDLSILPAGVYIVAAIDQNGRSYGMKITR